MTRASLTTAERTEFTGLDYRGALLLKIDFSGGAILTCTGNGPVTYDDTYLNDGTLLGAGGIEERPGVPPKAIFKLAPTSTLKTRVAAGGYRRKTVEFYQATLDTDYQVVGAQPLGVYRISKFRLQRSQDSYFFEMACSSDLDEGDRAHAVYPSDTMQQQRYSGDNYMNGSASNAILEFEWGGHSYSIDSAGCVAVDEMIDGVRAGDIKAGDILRVADPDTLEESQAEVLYSGLSLQPGVRITTETGRTLVCSASAPIATDCGLIRAKHLYHYDVRVEGGEYEYVVSVESLGEIAVQHIYAGERCFWVNGFLHHNKQMGDSGRLWTGSSKFNPGPSRGRVGSIFVGG